MNSGTSQLVKNYNSETYYQALEKLKNSSGKILFIDQKLGVHYANIFRRIFEKIKACFGKIDQTRPEIVKDRLIKLIQLGETQGWLNAKKTDELSTQIFLIQGIKIHSVQVETSEKSMQNLSTPLKSKEFTKQQSLLNRAVADTQMDLGYSTQAIAERQSIIKEPSHEHTISIPQHSTQSAAAVEEANEISPLEEKHSQQTLPFFIFEDQNGTRSIYDILKKTYPTCVFANEDEIQSLMEQNKNLPIEIFYVKRFDDSFETFATLKHLVAQILKDHQNVHLTLIGASMQNDQIKLEEKMKQFEEALQSESFPNPQLKETKTISLRFKSMMGGKQILESNVEKKFIEQISQQIGSSDASQIKTPLNATHPFNVQTSSDLKNQLESAPKEQMLEKPQSIEPIQEKKSPSNPLPLFIFNSLQGSKGIHHCLKQAYPNEKFISENELDLFLNQNSSEPIQAFYFISFDNRLEDRQHLIPIIHEILKYPNVNLVYVGVAKDIDSLNIEQSMKGFQDYLHQQLALSKDRVKTMSLRYHVMTDGTNFLQSLDSNVEKNFLNQIQQSLSKK